MVADISRHFDAGPLNALANHPAIRPHIGDDGNLGTLDFAAFVANPKNHAVVWAHGAFSFLWTGPETYEVHLMTLPEGRGLPAYRMAKAALVYIAELGAERLWSRVPQDRLDVRHIISSVGFERCGDDVVDIGYGPVAYDLYQWKKPCPKHC